MHEPLDPNMFDRCMTDRPPIRIGDKWTAKIIACLRESPRRFSELQVPLHMVSPKVLTESLRAMARDGLITRTAYDESPPRVEYALTALGQTLLVPMDAGCAWSQQHLSTLLDARDSYERATPV